MADGVLLTHQGGRRAAGESAIRVALFLAALLSVVTTTLIVLSLVRETVAFLGDVGVGDFLFGSKWTPQLAGDQQSFGAVPLMIGTLYLTGIGLVVAIPLGLLCAIYLAEYASPRVRKVIKPILEVLAGVPTIVFGFFALTFVTPEILRGVFGLHVEPFNQLAAGIIVGILVLPTIASVAEDAMSAVPQSLREGAFGLGASRMKVALRVVFPAALSGIVAALVLGASRAIGETLVILLAGGSGQLLPEVVWSPLESGGSMASFIASTATGDAPTGSIEYETIFAVGMLLFVFTLVLNVISIRLVNRFRQVYE
jgi:phosphate transport system permease protein